MLLLIFLLIVLPLWIVLRLLLLRLLLMLLYLWIVLLLLLPTYFSDFADVTEATAIVAAAAVADAVFVIIFLYMNHTLPFFLCY